MSGVRGYINILALSPCICLIYIELEYITFSLFQKLAKITFIYYPLLQKKCSHDQPR